jgi:hypothetical protein
MPSAHRLYLSGENSFEAVFSLTSLSSCFNVSACSFFCVLIAERKSQLRNKGDR